MNLIMKISWFSHFVYAVIQLHSAQSLSVTLPFLQALKNIETAIIESPLGLNPKTDGERLIAAIPP